MVIVILPAFNEEEALPLLLERVQDAMTENGLTYRVIVVNDGSGDGTARVVDDLAGRMPVSRIDHERNRGLGEAVRTGLLRAVAEADEVSIMDAAWVLPNLNLARYDSLYLRPTGVSFRAVTGAGNRAGRRIEQTEFPIADQHKLAMRTDFEQAFREEFSAIAANPVSAVPGRRVLMAQGFLVDVVSSLPPDEPGTEYIQNLNWEATIVLELRDSMSDDIVARTVERERIQEIVDSDFVREQIRQLTSRWARLLHTRFDELSAIAR
jgi:glycosyltransferase involved in cell wall biosynthesis